MQPSCRRRNKVHIFGPDQITKVAAMPTYGKKTHKIFYRTTGPIVKKLCYMAFRTLVLQSIYLAFDFSVAVVQSDMDMHSTFLNP